jgi:hypothetical protein
MVRAYKIEALVILVIILVPSAMIGACAIRERRYRRGFEQIEVGQTKRGVVDALGEPSEVQVCSGPVYRDGKVTGECAETYYYHSFLVSRGFLLDRGGKVVGKFHHVSG